MILLKVVIVVVVYTDSTSGRYEDCGREVKLGAATVFSHSPSDLYFSHSQECEITFVAENENWRLMIQFEYLDIPDYLYTGVCSDALYIYDSDKIGKRTFVSTHYTLTYIYCSLVRGVS